jgi:hypothetical protein
MKKCKKCKSDKENSRFYSGHEHCISCHLKNRPEDIFSSSQKNNIIRKTFTRPKKRATDKSIEFTITREWLNEKLLTGRCEQTNKEFVFERNSPYIPSIDRIDNSKGYTPENCQLVTVMYNFAKNKWSDETVREMFNSLK